MNGKFTKENLHTMFDGIDMKFDASFYRFFIDNQEQIFNNQEVMRNIPKIQREMPNIKRKFEGYMPTVEECMRYLSEVTYVAINDGNQDLAEYCKLCGVSQKDFEEYQKIHEEQKKRHESTIPHIKNKRYKFLKLADPKTLLIGEGKFSKCCQKLHGQGEECMKHSATSKDGRIFEVLDDDGTLIAQSWVWRNGNVICFDSIEANAIQEHKYSDADRKKLIDKIEAAYRQAGSELIERTNAEVEEYRVRKQREIGRLDISEDEKAEMLQALEQVCEDSKVKMVTVGKGFWDISKKITSRFSSEEVAHGKDDRISPREKILYLNDSNIQYVVAKADNVQSIKTDEASVDVMYRDKRDYEIKEGTEITPGIISRIRKIEKEAHKEKMQLLGEVDDSQTLARTYGTRVENIKLLYGEDWYYIYSDENNEIHIHDLAHGTPRFDDEKTQGSVEIGKALGQIILESVEANKPISADLREDTSYAMILKMKERGLIEQIGEDKAFEFSKEDSTIMHHFTFKPTEKYVKMLREKEARRKQKKDKIDLDDMEV